MAAWQKERNGYVSNKKEKKKKVLKTNGNFSAIITFYGLLSLF